MSTGGVSPCCTSCLIASSLPSSLPTNSSFWSIVLAPALAVPIVMYIGLVRTFEARSWMFELTVALKSPRWQVAGQWEKMSSIWVRKEDFLVALSPLSLCSS